MSGLAEKSQRNSNIELLRIFSMLCIVAYHYFMYGFYSEDLFYTGNKFLSDILGDYGQIGVNLYLLISGYFLTEQRFSLKRLLTVAGQVWFYCWGILLVLTVLGKPPAGLELKYLLFPLTMSHYWFASYYVLLLLLAPALNFFVHRVTQRQHLAAILVMMLIYSVVPTFLRVTFQYTTAGRMVMLYLMAAYVRLYLGKAKLKTHCCLALFWYLCILGFSLFCDVWGQLRQDEAMLLRSMALAKGESFFGHMLTVELLICAVLAKPRHIGWVNRAASLTFGVYLFHENYFISPMWQSVFHTRGFAASPLLILHALGTILAVYLAGSLLDLLRQLTLGKLWGRLLDRFAPPLEARLRACFDRLLAAVNRALGA